MNALLARLRDVYVSPAKSSATSRGRTVAPAPAAAVLGPPWEAAVAAAALALALARAGRWQCGLAAFWRAAGGPPGCRPTRAPGGLPRSWALGASRPSPRWGW